MFLNPPDPKPFQQVKEHVSSDGYIVWRTGTGYNTELLHIKSCNGGGGHRLLEAMILSLKNQPPFSTIFGFCRISNERARNFYIREGFTLSLVEGVYADGQAIVFSAKYSDLLASRELL